jgi:peptide/nickel transport system permease protein
VIVISLRHLIKDKLAIAGLTIILLFLIIIVFAPLLVPYDPIELNLADRLQGVSGAHWMGTDGFGRDVLSRVIYGTRLSLTIALVLVVLTACLGVIIGGIAGYLGGIVDELIMRGVDILLAFPKLILALVIVAVLGPSLVNVIIAMAATGWVSYSRVVRGSVLSIKREEFVLAARALGCGSIHIFTSHIIPNIMAPVIVLATLDMGHIILSISALSFLGLGAQPPTPEWGAMLNEGRSFMQSAPHLMIFPGLMIMLTVLAFNLVGDGLRDVWDPYMHEVR